MKPKKKPRELNNLQYYVKKEVARRKKFGGWSIIKERRRIAQELNVSEYTTKAWYFNWWQPKDQTKYEALPKLYNTTIKKFYKLND